MESDSLSLSESGVIQQIYRAGELARVNGRPYCSGAMVAGIARDNDGWVLLADPAQPPFGLVPPSGHVLAEDLLVDGEPVSLLAAAGQALGRVFQQQVGLSVTEISWAPVNAPAQEAGCHWADARPHVWWVAHIATRGNLRRDARLTRWAAYVSPEGLRQYDSRTVQHQVGQVHPASWAERPGLSPVCRDILQQLELI